MKASPRPLVGVLCLAAYLAAFYGVWILYDVDYPRVGEDAGTLLRWYVLPLAAGGAVLVATTTALGWWRPVLAEPRGARAPRWVLLPGLLMALTAVAVLLTKDYGGTSAAMLALLVVGSLGVGFGEEVANRGLLLTGLRGGLTEPLVWFWSCLCFGLMHLPNWWFGAGPAAVVQVVLAFLAGTTLYLVRRGTGLLVWAMLLHGLWDFSSFVGEGADWAIAAAPALGLLSLGVALVLLRGERGRRVAEVPPAVVPDPA